MARKLSLSYKGGVIMKKFLSIFACVVLIASTVTPTFAASGFDFNNLILAYDIKKESNKEFLQKELEKINNKYNTNLYVDSDYDYEKLSKSQLLDIVNFIINELEKINLLETNLNSLICAPANDSINIPTQTIYCAMLPVKLEGTISYTAADKKFESIDSLKTWIVGNEVLIKHTWTQHHWESSINDGGKSAKISLRGTLKGEMLIKGSPIAFTQEVDRTFALNF